jgi:hypothetical protein
MELDLQDYLVRIVAPTIMAFIMFGLTVVVTVGMGLYGEITPDLYWFITLVPTISTFLATRDLVK